MKLSVPELTQIKMIVRRALIVYWRLSPSIREVCDHTSLEVMPGWRLIEAMEQSEVYLFPESDSPPYKIVWMDDVHKSISAHRIAVSFRKHRDMSFGYALVRIWKQFEADKPLFHISGITKFDSTVEGIETNAIMAQSFNLNEDVPQ